MLGNENINVAIAGVGNCASSFVQGVLRYGQCGTETGLITSVIGQYSVTRIKFVAAFDVDARKVGLRLDEAILAQPNNAMTLCESIQPIDVTVRMGPVLDGVAGHMSNYPEKSSFRVAGADPIDVCAVLRQSKADVLVCYLPVGSTEAVRHYAEAALASGVAFVNCVPVFIANDGHFAQRFADAGLPLIGDDVRSQVGATIVHQRLLELMSERGYEVVRSYQLNVGGNTDFLNMMDQTRLADKRQSKTGAILSRIGSPVVSDQIHVGPSDYVAQLNDSKIAFIRIEGKGYGGAPLAIDLRLEVQDSPNSAAVVTDLVRYAAVARNLRLGGVLWPACSYYMKSPPKRMSDREALEKLEQLSRS
jgi:myo-inositol-1-phosphate synthase